MTTHELEYLATYLMPGAFFPEETTKRLDAYDPHEAAAKAPENAYCFTIAQRPKAPDLGPDFWVTGRIHNRSKRFYLGGRVYAEPEVAALSHVQHPGLLANMQGNHWSHMILCRTGNWQPFMDGDTLLEVPA